MKKWSITLLLMALALIVTAPATAQEPYSVDAKTIPGWFEYPVGTLTGTPSTPDTSAVFRPGGYNLSSLTLSVADTIRDTVYVDWSTDGTTYANIASQIITSTTGAAQTFEVSLRDNDSDLFDGVAGYCKVRNKPAATGNGTAASYPVTSVKLNFKP